MRPPARVWHGVDATPELTSLIREWLTRSSPPPQRPRTLLDVLEEQAPMAKENHGRSWQDRPLTKDELRHQKIQDRLMAERRKAEEELGYQVDLLATGEWIT